MKEILKEIDALCCFSYLANVKDECQYVSTFLIHRLKKENTV